MLLPQNYRCARCGHRFEAGDRIRIVNVGRVEIVGGAGIFKDHLTVRATETREHDGDCPTTRHTKTTS